MTGCPPTRPVQRRSARFVDEPGGRFLGQKPASFSDKPGSLPEGIFIALNSLTRLSHHPFCEKFRFLFGALTVDRGQELF